MLEYGRALKRIVYRDPSVVQVGPGEVPAGFVLDQNHPNPFVRETVIPYTLRAPEQVKLEVFDVLGRKVATVTDAWQGAGSYTAHFDADSLPQGMYFYQLQAGSHIEVKAMVRMAQ